MLVAKRMVPLFISCMVACMLALFAAAPAYAGVTAPGGNVASSDADAATAAFGGGADVSYDDGVLTIALVDDVNLDAPVTFTQGAAGDTVVVDLSGHALTGADGVEGSDADAAAGKSAIQIVSGAFVVVVQGPGSVTGGKGAIYESEASLRSGRDGGCAVCFLDSAYYPEGDGKLDYGLVVRGGAALTGGTGGDVTSADWLHNIQYYTGSRGADSPGTSAGAGAAAIGQLHAGVLFGADTMAFAKIIVEDATVAGGVGGGIDMTQVTPTDYALMTCAAAQAAMSEFSVQDYGRRVLSMSGLVVGKGGDGIRVGPGRKFIDIGAQAKVSGSPSGVADLGDKKAVNRLSIASSDAGDGIAVWVADLGLTDANPTSTEGKTRISEDMGLYVEGAVTGGSAPDADALNQSAGDGGAGIALYGDADRYDDVTKVGNENSFEVRYPGEDFAKWGIVDIAAGARVAGGNGGSAVSGAGGLGGTGLYEEYELDNENDTHGDHGTNYYIIDGTVAGGDGGSSLANAETHEDKSFATVIFVPGISRVGSYGFGGFGVNLSYGYRAQATVAGSGTVAAGNAGNVVNRDSVDVSGSQRDALNLARLDDPDYGNTVSEGLTLTQGGAAQALARDKVEVTAGMTAFDGNPDTSTKLSCDIAVPDGYTGPVYLPWVAVMYPNIGHSGSDYTGYPCYIESSGADYTNFALLGNGDYGYLRYPMYADNPDLGMYHYTLDAAVAERFQDADNKGVLKQVYCYVLLDDGRWGKSNVMEFDTKGWNGTSSGGDDEPSAQDKAAADNVQGQINVLDAEAIDLRDADWVAGIRAEYEALTPAQKALVDASKLEAAEAKIEALNQAAADEVIGLIEGIPSSEAMADMDADELAATKSQIEEAIAAYNALSDYQKEKLFGYVAYLEGLKSDFNGISGDKGGPTVDGEIHASGSGATLTAAMITIANATYNGKALKPAVTVKANGKTLKVGTDYTVEYANNVNAGKGTATVSGTGGYTGKVSVQFTIAKAANPLKVSGKTATVKAKKVKKKAQKLSVAKVIKTSSKGQGAVTYAKASGNKKISINKATGKVTVKKGLKKGTYKVKMKVQAAGNANYEAATKTVTFKVKVK